MFRAAGDPPFLRRPRRGGGLVSGPFVPEGVRTPNIEDFETDLTAWTQVRGTNSFAVTAADTPDGDSVAELSGTVDDWNIYFDEDAGVGNGGTVSAYLMDIGGANQPFVGWYPQDAVNGGDFYSAMIAPSGEGENELEIRRWDDGGSNLIGSDTSGTIEAGKWYDVDAHLDGDTFTATVFEIDQRTGKRVESILQTEATDATYSAGSGAAFGNRNPSGGAGCRVDGIGYDADVTVTVL